MENSTSKIYIGLMSGTSLDGVDAVAATFAGGKFKFIAREFVAFSDQQKSKLFKLCQPGFDEVRKLQEAGNMISRIYAGAVQQLLSKNNLQPKDIAALGAHGQTIRHSPQLGVSTQAINGALLAELTDIDVVCDFRNRDMAAGGQGAPLVPAFHESVFCSLRPRVIANIGGISNITVLNAKKPVIGFDCGPGNMLMDFWIRLKKSLPFDADGAWAKQGKINQKLLEKFLADPFFSQNPPKSTGRELFNEEWLKSKITDDIPAADVQRTLLELTVVCISDAIDKFAPKTEEICICGGGSKNAFLMKQLKKRNSARKVITTNDLGLNTQDVEGAAFAWLAWRFKTAQSGNLPEVTGAKAKRVLGCLYPH